MSAPQFAIGDRVAFHSSAYMLLDQFGLTIAFTWKRRGVATQWTDRRPDVAELVALGTVTLVYEKYSVPAYALVFGDGSEIEALESQLTLLRRAVAETLREPEREAVAA